MRPAINSIETGDSDDSQGRDGWTHFYDRFAMWILAAYLFLAPAYLLIAKQVLTPGDMSAYLLDVAHWLPNDQHLIADMEKFSTVAGYERGRVVRISWPNCQPSDPRLQQFKELVAAAQWPEDFLGDELRGPIFQDVLTFEDLYQKLHAAAPNLSRAQIHSQLQNVMLGDNGTTCIIATLTTSLPKPRARAIEEIYSAATSVENLDSDSLRLFGGPVYTSQLDKSGANVATQFTPFSILISLICAWFCVRRWRILVALFLNALLGTSMALVSVYFCKVQMDPVLMLMPGFWMIMMLSGGLHFVNYYFETKQTENASPETHSANAARTAFLPAFLATFTTCIGLLSLCTSDVMPVFRFGLQSAIGLACAFTSQFLFLPSFLRYFDIRNSEAASSHPFWNGYEQYVVKFQYKTVVTFLLLIVLGAYGFSHLGFSNRLKDQFAQHLKINTDTDWFEQEIGPLVPFEILIRFPKSELPRPSQCLGYVDSLQQKLAQLDAPLKLLSPTAIVPYDAGTGARQTMKRAILDRRLKNQRETLRKTGYVMEESDHELWRISAFAYSSGTTSMSDYFAGIQKAVLQHQQQYQDSIDARITYAGLGARMAVITGRLGGGLLYSSLTSAILISIVVVIALRSLVLGLTAMLPNMFPVLISFGAFGFFSPSLDIGAIMTASIAMGIAVDDTIHFMYWFRKGLNSKMSRVQAIQLAIRKSGRAIAATSLICGLGFCVYFFCEFMPIARFGQLLFLMLAAALVGDLFFLPALLRSLPEKWLVAEPAE